MIKIKHSLQPILLVKTNLLRRQVSNTSIDLARTVTLTQPHAGAVENVIVGPWWLDSQLSGSQYMPREVTPKEVLPQETMS